MELPPEKLEPMNRLFDELKKRCLERLVEYESSRASVHWLNEDGYRHIEKAFGEFALSYHMSRNGAAPREMLTEIADGVNHLLMALHIKEVQFTYGL